MIIRDAVTTDLPTIVEIYNHSIPTRIATADLQSVSIASRQQWFEEHELDNLPLWVMEVEGIIAGWLSFQRFNRRQAYDKTAELSIYISPDYRRCGVGKKLLQEAILKSPQLGIKTLIALIFAHNHPSLALFSKHGFQQWGLLPQVAELDGMEKDLVIMGLRVDSLNYQNRTMDVMNDIITHTT